MGGGGGGGGGDLLIEIRLHEFKFFAQTMKTKNIFQEYQLIEVLHPLDSLCVTPEREAEINDKAMR